MPLDFKQMSCIGYRSVMCRSLPAYKHIWFFSGTYSRHTTDYGASSTIRLHESQER